MDMDIIRRIKPLIASFEKLNIAYKITLLIILVSFASTIFPHQALAVTIENEKEKPLLLIFILNDHLDFVRQTNSKALQKYRNDEYQKALIRQQLLAQRVQEYLEEQRSPLAPYAKILITLKNWKKIIALANAESTMCKRYREETANCWGIGGANLWTLGKDLGEGIKSVNNFLSNNPKKSKVKYAQMDFKQMNGLYKQPAAEHWVYNNETVYQDLTKIEQSL